MNYLMTQVKRTGKNRMILFGILAACYLPMILSVFLVPPDTQENSLAFFLGFLGSIVLMFAAMVFFFIKALLFYKDYTKSRQYRALGELGMGSPEEVSQAVSREVALAGMKGRVKLTENWICIEGPMSFQIRRLETLVWAYVHTQNASDGMMFCFTDGKQIRMGMWRDQCNEMLLLLALQCPNVMLGYSWVLRSLYKQDPVQFARMFAEYKENGGAIPEHANLGSLVKMGELYAEFKKVLEIQRSVGAFNNIVEDQAAGAGTSGTVDDISEKNLTQEPLGAYTATADIEPSAPQYAVCCTSCGKLLAAHEAFCTKCGHKVANGTVVSASPAITSDMPISAAPKTFEVSSASNVEPPTGNAPGGQTYVRFCASCGKPLAHYEAFCTKCGHKVTHGVPFPSASEQVPNTPVAARQQPDSFKSAFAGGPVGHTVAPVPARSASETEKQDPLKTGSPGPLPLQAAQFGTCAHRTGETVSARPHGKAKWAIIGGVTIPVVIIAALLVPGWLQQIAETANPPDAVSDNKNPGIGAIPPQDRPSSTTSPPDTAARPAQIQELTQEQQKILDTLAQKFPEILPGLVDELIISDEPFLAAAKQAFYTDPVFDEHSLTIRLMLPDPRAASLNKLGITPYAPHSGAQAYIRESYEKLRRMEGITDWLEYPVTFQYQKGIDGENLLDPTLHPIYFALMEYSDVFKPHVDQYMTDMGFYAAALELLMPISGRWVDSPDLNAAYMPEYLNSLAGAMTYKGVEIDGKTVVDKAKIQQMLEERLAPVWVCDSVSVYTDVFQQPKFKMRSLSGSIFMDTYERLNIEYDTGRMVKHASFEELERVFLSTAQELAGEILESGAAKDREHFMEREYPFDWETLGKEGISACPELVDEMGSVLWSYDFYLRFLASWQSIGE